jgi:flagella basal body P-ring formation protein FlgA
MKQASNSLLTLYPIPFKAKPRIPAFPRDEARVAGRLFTPFRMCQEKLSGTNCTFFLELSCLLRSLVRLRLGEGRIRGLLHTICLISFAASLCPVKGADEGTIAINLIEQASIQSDKVFLKDVADLQGADTVRLDKLALTQLCDAPPFGVTLTLSRHQIGELLLSAAGRIPGVSITGAEIIQIRLRGKPVTSDQIKPLLKAYFHTWKESEIEIRSIKNLDEIELPPGAQLQLSSRKPALGRGRIVFAVEVLQGEKILQCFWLAAEVRIHAEIAKAARAIRRGTAVSPEDIVLAPAEIIDLQADYLRTREDVIGKAPIRGFAPGDLLVRGSFVEPIVIKNGDAVHMNVERNGILLTALGHAEQDGRLGQTILVRSVDFSRPVKAQVTGRAEVKIQ